jgi:hypothetical protein
VNLKTTKHVMAALEADYAIQEAIRQAKYGERVMTNLRLVAKQERRQKPSPNGVDIRQLHRQHCEPEGFSDWGGLLIAAVIVVGICAAVVIGSTIDYWGL